MIDLTTKRPTPGLLITFEGGEGTGKSTQIKLLAEHFRAAGREVTTLREPGGTPIGEKIRTIVLDPATTEMAFTTEVFLFQAQRAQLYAQIILPELQKEGIVLLDRSRDSSLIYQGIVRGFGKELIEQLNTISTQSTYPNLTFLLDAPVEVGLDRKAQAKEQNRLENEHIAFHQQVREAYLAVAKENKDGRWHLVDANQPAGAIAEKIWPLANSAKFG